MARRRKISRKMPPLRQVDPSLMGTQNINNWSQANIDQNEAASFNQQFRVRAYDGGGGGPQGGVYDKAAMNAAGVNQNWGANNANIRQNRVTGAVTDNSSTFRASTIPGQSNINDMDRIHLLDPGGLVGGNEIGTRIGGESGKPINTFSSEIDPTDKTEFQNEVVNNVMKSDPVANLSNPVEPARPQNKFEELYKPS